MQIEQDLALCVEKFPDLICRPIAAQFMADPFATAQAGYVIALFELQDTDEGIKIVTEKHYRLVTPDEVREQDLNAYKQHTQE